MCALLEWSFHLRNHPDLGIREAGGTLSLELLWPEVARSSSLGIERTSFIGFLT